LAKAKGFQLARLHDVESRKWQLDVQIPIVWSRLWLEDIRCGIKAWLDAGDSVETDTEIRLRKDGQRVDAAGFFREAWNSGQLHPRGPGEGQLTARLDWERAAGQVVHDAFVTIAYRVAGASKLRYVTPKQARGIFDEDTKSFTTVHFDVGKTLEQELSGAWIDIFNPRELAVRLAGTVLTLDETAGIDEISIGPIHSLRGADRRTRGIAWQRRQAPPNDT
jgi:hypothetical protein